MRILGSSFFVVFSLLVSQAHASDRAYSIDDVRVLSYNIKCLPFPKKCTKAKMRKIGEILAERRLSNSHPQVVLIQEAFVSDFQELVKAAGYPYIFQGPNVSYKNPEGDPTEHSKVVGSGLWILSDYPALRTEQRIFRNTDCTSWDCYSKKGVMLAEVKLPSGRAFTFMTTHMNSGSSEKAEKMRGRQLDDIKDFTQKFGPREGGYIFAGDFNLRVGRENFALLPHKTGTELVSLACLESKNCRLAEGTSVELAYQDTVDHHLSSVEGTSTITPYYLERNFTEKIDDKNLSDHLGYEVHYRIEHGREL